MEFQWYPGHMTKAKRQMQEDIKLIDLVIEVIDARCPVSSRKRQIDVTTPPELAAKRISGSVEYALNALIRLPQIEPEPSPERLTDGQQFRISFSICGSRSRGRDNA